MKIKFSKITLQNFVILGVLIFLIVVLSLITDKFLSVLNLLNVLRQITVIVITGCAVTLLMISGNFDLSVGGILVLTGVIVSKVTIMGIPMMISIFIAVLAGGLMGIINGAMVVKLKIPSIIATLGMLYVTRGLALLITAGKTLLDGLPENFGFIGRGSIGHIPVSLIIMIFFLLLFYFIQSKTVFGKYTYAIGGNKLTALLSGVNVDAIVLLLYLIVGLLAGVSGVMTASRLGVGSPNVGMGFEFDVIIAVIIGGIPIGGGEGSVIGMLMGASIVGLLANALNLLNIHSFYQSIVKGLVLVGAVLLDKTIKERIK
jgi:ribose/xylose/arabinose/galactoside ABC-type transport system permease subunit